MIDWLVGIVNRRVRRVLTPPTENGGPCPDLRSIGGDCDRVSECTANDPCDNHVLDGGETDIDCGTGNGNATMPGCPLVRHIVAITCKTVVCRG